MLNLFTDQFRSSPRLFTYFFPATRFRVAGKKPFRYARRDAGSRRIGRGDGGMPRATEGVASCTPGDVPCLRPSGS